MSKEFKVGNRVYHKSLKMYGVFLGYVWETKEECDVDFSTEDREDQRHVTVKMLELVPPIKQNNNHIFKDIGK